MEYAASGDRLVLWGGEVTDFVGFYDTWEHAERAISIANRP